MGTARLTLSTALVLVVTVPVWPGTWNESGDANQLTGQVTHGMGMITTITGQTTIGVDGSLVDIADLYAIRIIDGQRFVASVGAGGMFDTQLFLFDSQLRGVLHNDDDVEQTSPNHSSISSAAAGIELAPGMYYLAISGHDIDPVNSDGQEIWADAPWLDVTAPDGPGRNNPRLTGWNTSPEDGLDWGNYAIELEGAQFAVPSPGALGALAGAWGLGSRRRRR